MNEYADPEICLPGRNRSGDRTAGVPGDKVPQDRSDRPQGGRFSPRRVIVSVVGVPPDGGTRSRSNGSRYWRRPGKTAGRRPGVGLERRVREAKIDAGFCLNCFKSGILLFSVTAF